jgi:deoxyribodipyrimidine photo-lyase
MPSLLWFRNDLRLADNPALRAAIKHGAVVPVYLHAPHEEHPWEPGGATRWWLHHSLTALDTELRAAGSRLIVRAVARRETNLQTLEKLLKETESTAVFWNRRYEPANIKHDTETKGVLRSRGITVESFNASLLLEAGSVLNQQGSPFQVFTPFWKACLAKADAIPALLPRPREVPGPKSWPKSDKISDLGLLPRIKWDTGFYDHWTPGEAGAHARFKQFLGEPINTYKSARDVPSLDGTSMLSPHLHFGEIGPRQIWHELQELNKERPPVHAKAKKELDKTDAGHFLREVGWRDFAYHLLFHFPDTPEVPLRDKYREFPWRKEPAAPAAFGHSKKNPLRATAKKSVATGSASASDLAARDLLAWQQGQTGYPIVDAGMRQLWHTGWMHNRVRMIVGSFLVKHLLLPWQDGAAWFWETLVDADLANNTLGWQWVAGCGADAAPYFRIFNPVLQGEKFDARGEYVRRWVPELTTLPDEYVHAPWDAPQEVLHRAKIQLGHHYPEPIIDHKKGREGALAALAKLKE